jgi:hypothetical protein
LDLGLTPLDLAWLEKHVCVRSLLGRSKNPDSMGPPSNPGFCCSRRAVRPAARRRVAEAIGGCGGRRAWRGPRRPA